MEATGKTLDQIWDEGAQWRDAATTYVEISREDFEKWVADTTRAVGKSWSVKQGTRGVYRIRLSENVGIEVGSTQAKGGKAVGYAKGSMQMRLVSLLTGRVLNKKVQGKSHFKRTKNWRTTLLKAAKAFKAAYLDSQPFYEALAEIGPRNADREKYKVDIITAIGEVPGWEEDDALRGYYQKVMKGGVLTLREKADMESRVRDSLQGKPRRNEEQEADDYVDPKTKFRGEDWFDEEMLIVWQESDEPRHKRLLELYWAEGERLKRERRKEAPKAEPPPQDSVMEQRRKNLLADMRKLWVAAKRRAESTQDPRREKDARWTMEFVSSVGKQLTTGGREWPTERQIDLLERKMDDYGL